MTTDTRRNLGNIVSAAISLTLERQKHFKSSGPSRRQDAVRVTQVGGTIKLKLDELIGKNMSIFALGSPTTLTDGSIEIDALTDTVFEGLLELVGENDEGIKVNWTGKVQFVPSGDFNFIQDNNNWNTVDIDAEILEDTTYGFGRWNIAGGAAAPSAENYTISTGSAYFTRTA